MAKHATLLAALLLCLASGAHAADCPPLLPTIKLDVVDPILDRSLDVPSLRKLSADGGPEQGTVLGLYSSSRKISLKFSTTNYAHAPAGSAVTTCLAHLEITIALRPVIYILKEISIGGCADDLVWAHEYNHHRIEIAKTNEGVSAYMAGNPLPTRPFSGRTMQEASDAATAYNKAYAENLGISLNNFIRPAQAAFDSPAEYRRPRANCPAEMDSIARRHPPSR